jgi:hypothetical protein
MKEFIEWRKDKTLNEQEQGMPQQGMPQQGQMPDSVLHLTGRIKSHTISVLIQAASQLEDHGAFQGSINSLKGEAAELQKLCQQIDPQFQQQQGQDFRV